MIQETKNIVVTIPCYNEAVTIAKVIKDFQGILPYVPIHVFDNNSTDRSAEIARSAGAIVHHVKKRGKGNVMRTIFDTIRADALIVVDGDDTYYAEDAPKLLTPVLNGEANMVVGNRLHTVTTRSMYRLHQIGNRLIVWMINRIFRTNYKDILSGYRVFSRHFIETVPLLTTGFETETELVLQALEQRMEIIELPISYRARPEGSQSKIRAFHDGYRIMLTALIILRDHRPIVFFGVISLFCFLIAGAAGVLRLLNYLAITSLPNHILTGTIIIVIPLAIVSLAIGLILSAIDARFKELSQIMSRRSKSNG